MDGQFYIYIKPKAVRSLPEPTVEIAIPHVYGFVSKLVKSLTEWGHARIGATQTSTKRPDK